MIAQGKLAHTIFYIIFYSSIHHVYSNIQDFIHCGILKTRIFASAYITTTYMYL